MNTTKLYVSQYGDKFYAKTLKELKSKTYGGRVSKMYVDKKSSGVAHVGYVIGQLWLTAYVPYEKLQ